MKPFLEIPMLCTNNENKAVETTVRGRPDNIDYYYPGVYKGAVIVMASGASLLTTLTFGQFEAALDAYDKHTRINPKKFGNLQLSSN
jgi:hypothetical protein